MTENSKRKVNHSFSDEFGDTDFMLEETYETNNVEKMHKRDNKVVP